MPFQRENLRALEPYRIHDSAMLPQYEILAKLRNSKDGLVLHNISCPNIQEPLVAGKTELKTWPMFGIHVQDLPDFRQNAKDADVPLFYTCLRCKPIPETTLIP